MKIVIYGLSGLIFLGLFIGGTQVFGKGWAEGVPVALEVRVPRARVLPGHPFYALKIRGQRAWLAELHGILAEQGNQMDFLDIADMYRKNLKNISFEEAFYEAQALSRLAQDFPEAADELLNLREDVFGALRDLILAGPHNFSFRTSRFMENPLPAIAFFDEVLRRIDEPERKARIIFYEYQIASDFHGRYLAGEFRLGAIFDFLSNETDFFSALRILDVLRDVFPESELANQLQFFRQELLGTVRFSFDYEFVAKEFGALDSGLRLAEELSDADFNYDRALEFYSSGLYDRALAQASLALSSLHSFLFNSFYPLEDAQKEIAGFRNEFESLKKDFESPLFLKQAEEGIAELLVVTGRGEAPSPPLFFRVRALLVALRELR